MPSIDLDPSSEISDDSFEKASNRSTTKSMSPSSPQRSYEQNSMLKFVFFSFLYNIMILWLLYFPWISSFFYEGKQTREVDIELDFLLVLVLLYRQYLFPLFYIFVSFLKLERNTVYHTFKGWSKKAKDYVLTPSNPSPTAIPERLRSLHASPSCRLTIIVIIIMNEWIILYFLSL